MPKEYKELLEEKKELERKLEITSLRNLVKTIAIMARNSKDMKEFAANLDLLVNKFDDLLK